MPRKLDSDSQIGRRLKLRDLHLFFTVVQHGSMAKAASQLGISQPSVSEVIANLEHTLGAQLFDRRQRGVEPTMYGDALLTRTRAVFDELRQGIKDIEFLADPTGGEVRIDVRWPLRSRSCVRSSVGSRTPTREPSCVSRMSLLPVGNSACVSESTTSSCNGSCRHTQVIFLQVR